MAQRSAGAAYRDSVRARLFDLAAQNALVVPVACTYPRTDASSALTFLRSGHPGGRLALIP